MTESRSAMFALVLGAAALAAPAVAAPLDGSALRSRVVGSDVRVTVSGFRGMESHIWRLNADGSATAYYIRAPIANDRGAQEEGSGAGRWAVRGDTLCIDIGGILDGSESCFTVNVLSGNRVTLVGGNHFQVLEGTIDKR